MSCRYNPGSMFGLSNGIMDSPGDSKYSMIPTRVAEAFHILKTKDVKRFGLHASLASNMTTNEYYPKFTGVLFREAVRLKEKTSAEIAFVNFSSGVGVPYRPEQQTNDILTTGHEVQKVYEEILTPAGLGNVVIYVEMERFVLAPHDALIIEAIHEEHIYKEYIGVDACAINLIRPAMYGACHHTTVFGKEDVLLDHIYDATGSLCENNDKFAIGRELPEIEMGDYPYTHDAGVRGFSMGYNYNGKLRSTELLLREDSPVQSVRRVEIPKDYSTTLDFCNIMDRYLK